MGTSVSAMVEVSFGVTAKADIKLADSRLIMQVTSVQFTSSLVNWQVVSNEKLILKICAIRYSWSFK